MTRWFGMLLFLTACGSPVVGAECRPGHEVCEGRCVDLLHDRDNCGSCGVQCRIGEACLDGVCLDSLLDGGLPDGNLDASREFDASRDAGPDARTDATPGDADQGDGAGIPDAGDGSVGDGGDSDGAPQDGALGDGSAGDGSTTDGSMRDAGLSPCPCDLGELCCDGVCVRPDRDPYNCGGCNLACDPGDVCAGGACTAGCDPPREICRGLCVDVSTSDPDNCGGCGIRCPTGICIDGACSDGVPGHVVLIGHSYRTSRSAMRRVAGNAVFMALGASVRVLVYPGAALRSAINGVDQAIDEGAAMRGRTWTRTEATDPTEVPALLSDADVFVVYSQARSDDATLNTLGTDWSAALMTFLLQGGVVVVFDGGGSHAGTWQILDSAGLMTVTGRSDISLDNVRLVAPGDAVATGSSLRYRAERESVTFTTADEVEVFEHVETGDAVVVHRVFTP